MKNVRDDDLELTSFDITQMYRQKLMNDDVDSRQEGSSSTHPVAKTT